VPNPSFTLMTPTTSDAQTIAQVVQAMAKEAGFDVKIQSTEFATSLDMADKGQFEAYVLAWSGRADPDGNIFSFDACKQPLNYAGYCKPESTSCSQVAHARDAAERAQVYERMAAQNPEGPADRVSLPPPLDLGPQREAQRLSRRARRDGAGAGHEDGQRRGMTGPRR
jgi:ABC-type transport system substrate-binding protein